MRGTILIGAGALARDMIDCFGTEAFVGIYVDPGYPVAPIRGVPVFSDWQSVCKIATHFVLGVADIGHREHAREAAMRAGLLPSPPLVSRTAVLATDAELAPGVTVGHMSVVGPNVRIEENVLLMHAVIVGHDSVIGANSVLCAGVCIGGYVELGERIFVGTNAVLTPKLKAGADTYIAAGAACFRNAEPGSTWIGNPARLSRATKPQE